MMIVFLSILSADTPTQKQLIKSLLRWWWWWLYFWAYLVLTHWGWGWPTREKMCQEFTGSVTATQRTLQETWTSWSVSHPWHIVNLVDVFLIAGLSVRFFPAHFSSSQNNKNTKKIKKSKNANAGHTFEMGGMAGHDIWSENCVCVHGVSEFGPA